MYLRIALCAYQAALLCVHYVIWCASLSVRSKSASAFDTASATVIFTWFAGWGRLIYLIDALPHNCCGRCFWVENFIPGSGFPCHLLALSGETACHLLRLLRGVTTVAWAFPWVFLNKLRARFVINEVHTGDATTTRWIFSFIVIFWDDVSCVLGHTEADTLPAWLLLW